jgi:hypothetical protein
VLSFVGDKAPVLAVRTTQSSGAPTLEENMLTVAQLARIESLGDNCEVGGFLRKSGNEDGGFFRWTLCPLKAAQKAIAEDFANLYQLDNLKPHTRSMVMDTANGIAYHTAMRAEGEIGAMVFTTPLNEREEIQQKEQSKAVYMAGKFLNRLSDPTVLFVLKRNSGLSLEEVTAFHEFLKQKAGSERINLLWAQVATDASRVGMVEPVGDSGLITGYVSRFAPYPDALNFDFESWEAVFENSFAVVDGKAAEPGSRTCPDCGFFTPAEDPEWPDDVDLRAYEHTSETGHALAI